MSKELILYLCGAHSLAFAVFHMFFPKLFKWKEDLKRTVLLTVLLFKLPTSS
jgi:hypothetical protein